MTPVVGDTRGMNQEEEKARKETGSGARGHRRARKKYLEVTNP